MMGKEVAGHVLQDCYRQVRAISAAEADARSQLERCQRLMAALERKGLLDRELEAVPGEETLAEAKIGQRAVQIEPISETQRLVERATRWLLRRSRRPLDIAAAMKQFGPAVQRFGQQLDGSVIGTERQGLASSIETWKCQGVPQELAVKSARLRSFVHVLDISEICMQTGLELGAVGIVYRGLGERLKIDWLRESDREVALGRKLAGAGAHRRGR